MITLAAAQGIAASARREAPGVYVAGAKLASVGLRARRGCTYHGMALNVAMDLAPFAGINPCGYAGLAVTSLELLGVATSPDQAGAALTRFLLASLGLVPGKSTGAPWFRRTPSD